MSEAQIAGGHKATLNNPKVSDEAKQHSKKVLDEEFNGGDGKSLSFPLPMRTKKLIHHSPQIGREGRW